MQFIQHKRLILLFFLSLLFSCKKQIEGRLVTLQEFPKKHFLSDTKTLNHETIGAIAVYSTNDYFLVLKHRSEYFFDVYSKKDRQKKKELCYRGQGPMDFIAPFYSGQFKDNTFFVFDRAKSMFSKISINKSILENKMVIDTIIDFSSVLKNQARDMFVTERGQYIYSEDFENCAYYVIDRDGNTQVIDNSFELALSKMKYELSQKLSTYNEGRFASIYLSFPKVDFASVESKKVYESVHFQDEIVIKDEKIEDYVEKTFFDAIDSTSEYVYCLYNNSEKVGDNSIIMVFDWNANPVCVFYLPKYYTYFSVDKNEKNIYLLNWETEEVSIYDIGSFL